jgi:peptidoglycan hydrolase CwlO-like protein
VESWLWSSAAIGAIFLIFKNLLVRKPPIEAEFATKPELQMLRSEINDRLAGLSTKVERMRTEIREERLENKKDLEERMDGIHARITELRGDVVAIRDAQVADTKALLNGLRAMQEKSR